MRGIRSNELKRFSPWLQVHSDYTYTLEYDDGSKKTHVPRDRIRPKQGGRTGPTGAQAAAADEETSDNDSDFQRESETDWDFESTPIEEDVLAAGDTEWEMVSPDRLIKWRSCFSLNTASNIDSGFPRRSLVGPPLCRKILSQGNSC